MREKDKVNENKWGVDKGSDGGKQRRASPKESPPFFEFVMGWLPYWILLSEREEWAQKIPHPCPFISKNKTSSFLLTDQWRENWQERRSDTFSPRLLAKSYPPFD